VFKRTRKRGVPWSLNKLVFTITEGNRKREKVCKKGDKLQGKYRTYSSSRDPNLEPSVLLREEKWEGSGSGCGSGSGITHPGLGSPSFPVVSLTLINMTK
jgi:hypothetical protein